MPFFRQNTWTVREGIIEQMAHFKYLRVTFHHNLTLEAHVHSTTEIAWTKTNTLLRFFYLKGDF